MVPCYNEIDCIQQAYQEIRAQLGRYDDVEILFVDDGSTDGTLDVIKAAAAEDPLVKYISFTRNFGLEAAFSAGFSYASKRWTIQFDADLQSPPAEMHKLVAAAQEGHDVVFAIRENRQDPWRRRIGAKSHQFIARRWLGIELPAGASVFRIARTSVARKIVETRLITPYFIATVPLVGASYTTVPTAHDPRRGGQGKWSLRSLLEHGVDLFVGFSYRPLLISYLLAALGLLVTAVTWVVLAAGGGSALAVATVVEALAAAGLVVSALMTRYLVRTMRTQAGMPRYQIRESNIAIRPADSLYEFEVQPQAHSQLLVEQVPG
jgi:glycosyltransferase involved in cell wall biosynthesis